MLTENSMTVGANSAGPDRFLRFDLPVCKAGTSSQLCPVERAGVAVGSGTSRGGGSSNYWRPTGEPVKRLQIKIAKTDLHARSMHETDHLYRCGTLKGPQPTVPTPTQG